MLTQHEADALIRMPKRLTLPPKQPITLPSNGQKKVLEAESLDGRERFHFDINRASIKVTQATYQNRSRGTILLRLDLDGPPHENPDETRTEVPCPHLHVYREGWETRWAICPVVDIPSVQRGFV